jgi:N-acetyltransferase
MRAASARRGGAEATAKARKVREALDVADQRERIEPITLTGEKIRLTPLRREDAEGLALACDDGALFRSEVTLIPPPAQMDDFVRSALEKRDSGLELPFVVTEIATDAVIGMTRYRNIDLQHRKVEIGSTWYAQSRQGSGVNDDAKYLLMRHAFETLGCVRVEFKTDVLNARSRAALRGIGAIEEGVMRQEMIMPNGRLRDSVYFSVLDREWPAVKARLEARRARKIGKCLAESVK